MNETVKILNPLQFKFYLKHGVKPVDLAIGYDNKVVYFYDREKSKEVWELWKEECKRNREEQKNKMR